MDRRSPIGPIKKLGRLKDRLKKTRYWTYLWVSISKILIFIARYVKFDICKFKKKGFGGRGTIFRLVIVGCGGMGVRYIPGISRKMG